NGFRAFGIKYELFNLKKAEDLNSKGDLIKSLNRHIFPPIKVVLTGKGKVGYGAKEILDGMKMKEVSVDQFLNKEFDEPVYVHIHVHDYYRRKDGKEASSQDFKMNPSEYESDFQKFANVADIFIAGHFHHDASPHILTREM